MPRPDPHIGVSVRDSVLIGLFLDHPGEGLAPQVLEQVQRGLTELGGVHTERVREGYRELREKFMNRDLLMQEITPAKNMLREWWGRFWNRPEMGSWVCRFCAVRHESWAETVEAIRRRDPSHIVVSRWDEPISRGSTFWKIMATKEEELGPVPGGLTHRAVWNGFERDKCWVCQSGHSTWGEPRGIAYLCTGCNPSHDRRAALTSD